MSFSGTVLVVDDEALVCTLTAENLRELGLTVAVANNGHRALAMLSEGLEIDLLITDIRMGDMDGFELARRVVAHRPQVKVIYMSAYTLPQHLPGNAVPGASLIAKPFSMTRMAALLSEVLK